MLQGGQDTQGDQAAKNITSDLTAPMESPSGTPQGQPHPGISTSVSPGHPGLPEGHRHLSPSPGMPSGALPSMGPLPSHSLSHTAQQKLAMLRMDPSGMVSNPLPHNSLRKKPLENIAGNGENAGNQHFQLHWPKASEPIVMALCPSCMCESVRPSSQP